MPITVYRLASEFVPRFSRDMHHLGVAMIPAICDRAVWVAVLTLTCFCGLIVVQIVIKTEAPHGTETL